MANEHDPAALAALPDDELFAAVADRGDLPRHVAIIMDGNGRWARKRCLPRVAGHRAGRHAVRRCVEACGRLGIEVLTLYTFSQENFNRPEAEVQALWHFLQESLLAEREELAPARRAAGGHRRPGPAAGAGPARPCRRPIDALAGNTGLVLNLALAYGGRQEIVRAAAALARRVAAGELAPDEVDEDDLRPGPVDRRAARSRPGHPHQRRGAPQQLPALAVGLLRAADHPGAVAGFRRARAGCWPSPTTRAASAASAPCPTRTRPTAAADAESALDPARWKRLLKVRP